MSKALNLGNLANNINDSGQLNAANGLYNTAPSAASLLATNFSFYQTGSGASAKMVLYYGTTLLLSIDSSGNIITKSNVTGFGTP